MFLEIKNISKSYGQDNNKVKVLNNINIKMNEGELCVLLGPSGSGKSTLLNIIGAIENSDKGEISIDGNILDNNNEKKSTIYRRNYLGYVFQTYNLIPNLNVRENIEVGEYLSKEPLNIDELLKVLGLNNHKDKLPSQLSGGQQQRTAIGRAIVKNPKLLLCDEPTGALDYKTSKEILKLIENINKKYNTTIIIVTHNEALKGMADRIITLKDGNIQKDYLNENKKSIDEIEW